MPHIKDFAERVRQGQLKAPVAVPVAPHSNGHGANSTEVWPAHESYVPCLPLDWSVEGEDKEGGCLHMQGGGRARLGECLLEALGVFAPRCGQHVLVCLSRCHRVRPQRQ